MPVETRKWVQVGFSLFDKRGFIKVVLPIHLGNVTQYLFEADCKPLSH